MILFIPDPSISFSILYDNVTKYVTDVIPLSCFVIFYHYVSTKSK